MPRYKVYYEGYYIVDAEDHIQAQEMDVESIYDESYVTAVVKMDPDDMFD